MRSLSHPVATDSRFTSTTLFSLALLLALAITIRPYPGIVHDAHFYLGALLNIQFPGALAQDLHFTYGSQDAFTYFPYIYRFVVDLLGYVWGTMVLSFIGQCLWIMSLWFLARSIFEDQKISLLAVAIAVINPIRFTPIGVGEAFLTPRIFTEALTMAALGSLMRGHPWVSLALLLGSMLLHPLMPLAGLLFWLFHQALAKPLWWLAFPAGIACAFGLAFAGVAPFDGLLRAVDPEWLAVVRVRGDFCFERFVDIWPWFVSITFIFVVVASTKHLNPKERQAVLLGLAVLLVGRLINWLGTDVIPNAFFLGIQLYRAGWIFSILGSFALAAAIVRSIAAAGASGRDIAWVAAAMLLGLWIGNRMPLMLVISSVAAILLAASWMTGKGRPVNDFLWRITHATCLALAFYVFFRNVIALKDAERDLAGLATDAVSIGAYGVIILWVVFRQQISPRAIRLGALALVVSAVALWDQRPEDQRALESRADYRELRSIIEPGYPIYWEGDHLVPWMVLRQESYFSCQQGTGAIFSRDLALDYQARREIFKTIGPLDFGKYSSCPLDNAYFKHQRTQKDLAEICRQSERLRYLALRIPAMDDPGITWRGTGTFKDLRIIDNEVKTRYFRDMHIYDCRKLTKD